MSRTDGVLHRLIARTALALGLVRSAPQVLREARVGEVEPIDPSTRFEPGDINVTGVLLTGAGILLGLWAIVVLVYPFFAYLARTRAVTSPPPIAAGRRATRYLRSHGFRRIRGAISGRCAPMRMAL